MTHFDDLPEADPEPELAEATIPTQEFDNDTGKLVDLVERAAPKTVNARALLAEVLHIDARMSAYKARREELRDELSAEALRRYEAEGAAPSWKVPRLGTATLAAVDSEAVTDVTDDDAYAEWVLNTHPTEAELVIRIPGHLTDSDQLKAVVATMVTVGARVDIEPAPAFLTALVKTGRADPDAGILIAEDGEIVPGVTVTKKDPYLSIRLTPEAKARARQQIEALLGSAEGNDLQAFSDAAAADVLGTLVDLRAEGEEEGAGDAPPPDDDDLGPERTSTIVIGDPELEQVEAPSE